MRYANQKRSENFIDKTHETSVSVWKDLTKDFSNEELEMMDMYRYTPEDIQVLRQLQYMGVPDKVKRKRGVK